MAKDDPKKTGKGTLIRGADGRLYYIPDDKLAAFRLPADPTADARSLLDKQGAIGRDDDIPGIHGEDLVTEGPKGIVRVQLSRLATMSRPKPRSS
jgi:hypothetical protein